jgi:1-acyl-sn-glycerol-3-phosphate acyltransferase
LHQLDAAQQYVFIVNHQSNLDIPVLVRTLKPFQLRWLAKKELLWVPFFGWAIVAGKHIIVDRTDRSAALDSFARAKQLISGGISPVIFPEGTRSGTGRLLPFKRGGFLLAAMTGTPIVPITINGSGAVLPPGAWRLRSGAVEVVVHAPISSENHRPGTLRVLSDHVREIIAGELRKAGAAEQGPARAGAVHSSIRAMTIDTES